MISIFNIASAPKLIFNNKNLFFQITKRNISARYRGSFLGLLWSFAYPLMMLCVYTFVFGFIFKARWGIPQLADNNAAFPLIMFCGLSVFNLFAEVVNTSPLLIVNNTNFVKKVIFPLEIIPISTVSTIFYYGTTWFILLLIGVLTLLPTLTWTALLLPITIIPLAIFSIGISFLISAFGVYLRDINHLANIITQILFFITPIFYPIELVPERFRWIIQINPLTYFIEETRKLFIYGEMPDLKICSILLVISLIVFQIGFFCFSKMKKGFADVL